LAEDTFRSRFKAAFGIVRRPGLSKRSQFMSTDEKNFRDGRKSALEDYVTIAIAEDVDLANDYCDILNKNHIPAVTATQKSYSSNIIGTAVMVPESFFEQAQEIVESQQNLDSFLEDAFNDTDDWNYDNRTMENDSNGNSGDDKY